MITRGGAQQSLAAGELVTRSAEVEATVYRIADQTHDSESAIFHLLENDPFAHAQAVAQSAEKTVPPLLERLRQLTADDPSQQHQVEQLAAVENGRLALMHKAFQNYQQNDHTGADQAMSDANALFRVDEIAGMIVENARQQLEQRQERATQQSINNRLVLALTAAAQLLMLASSWWCRNGRSADACVPRSASASGAAFAADLAGRARADRAARQQSAHAAGECSLQRSCTACRRGGQRAEYWTTSARARGWTKCCNSACATCCCAIASCGITN
jgi:hypothetical protein